MGWRYKPEAPTVRTKADQPAAAKAAGRRRAGRGPGQICRSGAGRVVRSGL